MALYVIAFVFGAVVGSFLNVCIYRIPAGKSIVRPASSCPSCGQAIPFYHNIPIISYMVLRGRCSSCGAGYSPRYPLVEALMGVLAVLLAVEFGPVPGLFVYFVFTAALVTITFIDLDHKIIPDVISLPGIVIGFGCSFLLAEPGPVDSAIGIVAGGGILLVIALGYYLLTGSEGMGMGDVKLLAMIGAFTGWKGIIVTLLAGSFVGAVLGIIVMVVHGKSSKYALPFGPFLAAGALVYLFFGPELIDWYVVRAVGP